MDEARIFHRTSGGHGAYIGDAVLCWSTTSKTIWSSGELPHFDGLV